MLYFLKVSSYDLAAAATLQITALLYMHLFFKTQSYEATTLQAAIHRPTTIQAAIHWPTTPQAAILRANCQNQKQKNFRQALLKLFDVL